METLDCHSIVYVLCASSMKTCAWLPAQWLGIQPCQHHLSTLSHLLNPVAASPRSNTLLVILLITLANNVVEPKLINPLAGAHNPQPIPELLLLQELLCQVLEVPSRKLEVADDLDLAVLEVGDGDVIAEVTGAAVDLDAGLQEGRKGGRVEDLVVGRLRRVDDVLLGLLGAFALAELLGRGAGAGFLFSC